MNININIDDKLIQKMKKIILGKKQLTIFIILFSIVTIVAESTDQLIIFQAGDKIKAEDINHNFDLLKNLIPTGTIVSYGGAEAPEGWLVCDGRAFDKSEYLRLWEVIGYSFGKTGDKFNIPDLRGKFLRGTNRSSFTKYTDPDAHNRSSLNGGNSGDNVGSYQEDQFKSHSHTTTFQNDWDDTGGSENNGGWSETKTVKTGSAGGLETRPKNVAVNFIIKL